MSDIITRIPILSPGCYNQEGVAGLEVQDTVRIVPPISIADELDDVRVTKLTHGNQFAPNDLDISQQVKYESTGPP